MIHQNHYRTDDIAPELKDYDTQVSEYNRTRSGGTTENDWCAHILGYYQEALSYRMLDYIKGQGFDVKK